MSSRLYRGGNPIKVASKAPRPEMWVCLIASLMVLLPCAGCVGLAAPKTGISALQITTNFLPNAQTGSQFQTGIAAAGGVQPYRWSIASGTLPPGLSLIPNSDAITGTASQGGQFDFSIQVSDSSSPAPQTAMKALTLSVLDCGGATAPSSSSAAGLSLVCSGTGINQAFTVELAQQFRLVFEASHNWVASQWYDLVNDPTASTNLLHTNDDRYCANTEGLNTLTFYTHSDASTGNGTDPTNGIQGNLCPPQSDTTIRVIESGPSRVVIQVKVHPGADFRHTVYSNIWAISTYFIYPDGKMYLRNTVSVVNAETFLCSGNPCSDYIGYVTLGDPPGVPGIGSGVCSSMPDSQHGWVRASSTQNPYSGSAAEDHYVFAYWDPTTPTYGNYTEASILWVNNPNNPTPMAPVIFSDCVHDFKRWGFLAQMPNTMSAGQSLSWDFLIQLGTQNSSVLPNITSSTVADPIANAYRSSPPVLIAP